MVGAVSVVCAVGVVQPLQCSTVVDGHTGPNVNHELRQLLMAMSICIMACWFGTVEYAGCAVLVLRQQYMHATLSRQAQHNIFVVSSLFTCARFVRLEAYRPDTVV